MVFSIGVILFCLCGLYVVAADEAVEDLKLANEKLKVQVYYETKCPDSIAFFREQLQPSMRNYKRLQYTDLQLIPFGKANVVKDTDTLQTRVYCQHGPVECEGNSLHACILENVESEKAFDVIACLMRSTRTHLSSCASQYNLDVKPVEACIESRSVGEILEKYGQETDKIDLSFVPSVALDGEFDYNKQNSLLHRFDRTFCRAYKKKYGKQLENCS